MGKITLITGGQRSGKSSYASKLVTELTTHPIYLATSRKWDDDHTERIKRHQQDRGDEWITIEEEKFISSHNWNGKTVLMDCVTLWLTNFLFDEQQHVEKCLKQAKEEVENILQQNTHFIMVTNELGMGSFPENHLQIRFNDLQGWMNQFIAKQAEQVIFMVSGIPVSIKKAHAEHKKPETPENLLL